MNTLTIPIDERDHLRGSPDAPVVLVEYGDFECPYCGAAYAVLKKLEKEMPDTLAVVFRQFPLVNAHPHAELAAEAAEATGAQGVVLAASAVLRTRRLRPAPARGAPDGGNAG